MNNESFTYKELNDIYHALQIAQSRFRDDNEMEYEDRQYFVEKYRDLSHKVMKVIERIEDEHSC